MFSENDTRNLLPGRGRLQCNRVVLTLVFFCVFRKRIPKPSDRQAKLPVHRVVLTLIFYFQKNNPEALRQAGAVACASRRFDMIVFCVSRKIIPKPSDRQAKLPVHQVVLTLIFFISRKTIPRPSDRPRPWPVYRVFFPPQTDGHCFFLCLWKFVACRFPPHTHVYVRIWALSPSNIPNW